MFRTGLLVSTAMTAVALLLPGASAGAFAQTDMHTASRDPNARFLCTYGSFLVRAYESASSSSRGYFHSSSQHVAVPIVGRGQTVDRIKVTVAPSASRNHSSFSIGIYSNNPSGFPGHPIAVGTGRGRSRCGLVTISIPATTLKSQTRYWIEEKTWFANYCGYAKRARNGNNRPQSRPSTCSSSAGLYWEANPNTKRKAYVQKHNHWSSSGGSFFSSNTPWAKQKTGPYLTLK